MPEEPVGLQATRLALGEWDLDVASLDLISMSENQVFRVIGTDGSRYAARSHRPGYNSMEELLSEHAWVDALDRAGFGVPRPILTREGHGYASAADDQTSRQVGVIEWVDGASMADSIDVAPEKAPQFARELGVEMARLHNHTEEWEPPAGFTRRRWDIDGLLGPDPHWGRFWAVPALTRSDRDIFDRARVRLMEELELFGMASDRFGLIHADLHPYNVLMSAEGPVVIDFDDCGHGWHMYDMAVALYHQSGKADHDEVRDAMVAGYRSERHLDQSHLDRLPAFMLMRGLANVGWLNDRAELAGDQDMTDLIQTARDRAEQFLG